MVVLIDVETTILELKNIIYKNKIVMTAVLWQNEV